MGVMAWPKMFLTRYTRMKMTREFVATSMYICTTTRLSDVPLLFFFLWIDRFLFGSFVTVSSRNDVLHVMFALNTGYSWGYPDGYTPATT